MPVIWLRIWLTSVTLLLSKISIYKSNKSIIFMVYW